MNPKPKPPDRHTPPVVFRVRMQYAKRGRMRFSSHRDFQRALERAVRRADVPIGYSAGFSPHPKISYAGAAPTGVASRAEFVELGLTRHVDPAGLDGLRRSLDVALPDGLDIVQLVEAGPGSLADRLQASVWRLELPGIEVEVLEAAVDRLSASDRVEVERMTKSGRRMFDVRAQLERCEVIVPGSPEHDQTTHGAGSGDGSPACAILQVVVRHGVPAARPDDVLAGLRRVSGLEPVAATRATRLAQGPWDPVSGAVGDPLAPDRDALTDQQSA